MPWAIRVVVGLLAGMVALAGRPGAALAHDQARSACTVHTVTGGIRVTVLTAGHLLTRPLGLAAERPDAAALAAAQARYLARLGEALTAATPAGACVAHDGATRVTEVDDEPALEGHLAFACPPGPVTLRNVWRLDVDPASECVCAIDGSAWVFRIGLSEKTVGTPPTRGAVLGRFVASGLEHVLAGADHLAFVLLLLVAAVRAGAGLTLTLRRTAAVITGFTLGHSVTLVAATLGWLALPARFTEAVIALSIAAVGVENLVRREVRLRGLTAAAFGLIHGFGFASVLSAQALAPDAVGLALLGFNLGIEAGQLALVLVAVPVLHALARRPWYRRRVVTPLSLLGVALATGWLAERLLGVEWLPG